ncbi:MAG: cation:proton antiporter [Dehalococcoidia bacterium]
MCYRPGVTGERELIVDLIIIIGAAAGGGLLASALRLPVILGYLAAGLVVGNYIPFLEMDVARVEDIAELGVALLLFSLGVQFSLTELRDVRRVAIFGGLAQIALTIAMGIAIGLAFGLDSNASLLLGAAMSLSSTMVVLKLLDARGEIDTLHGRVALGLLLVQDLAVVPLVILVPAIAGETGLPLLQELALAAGKAALLLGAGYVLASRVVPWFLFRIAATGSRELFLLAVLSLAFGLAAGSFALGLSIAFGAFLAGLIISESEFSHQTLADVLPLRDVFATIFFVSMGLLIDPAAVLSDPELVAAVTAGLVLAKLALTAAPIALLNYPPRVAALVGLSLAQGGEFSFVLTRLGLDEGIISDDVSAAILMAVLLSIVISSLLFQSGPALLDWAEARPVIGPALRAPLVVELGDDPGSFNQHVIVCGYGRVGRELVRELTQRDFRCVVVEQNPYLIDELRRLSVPFIYGDAGNPVVLDACGLDRARVLALTLPDAAAAQLALAHAKRTNPRLDVIVRGLGPEDHQRLLDAGASEVVHPEFEAGLEFVRHALHRFGVDSTQIQALLARRRRDFYRER